MLNHSPSEKILDRILNLCSAAHREYGRAVCNHDDSATLWDELVLNLELAANGVMQNCWTNVFETIRHAEMALGGDWSWKE